MKKWIKFYRGIPALFAALLVLALSQSLAYADTVDPDRAGSISITMLDKDTKEPVAGGTLELYQVAGVKVDEVGQPYYYHTEDFAACDSTLLEDPNDSTVAPVYEAHVTGNEITPLASCEVDADGVAQFPDLAVGVYLIMQGETAEGYYAIPTFVVTVPLKTDDGLVYDVDATPKVEGIEAETTEEPPTTEPPTTEPITEETTTEETTTEAPTTTEPVTTTSGGGTSLITGDTEAFARYLAVAVITFAAVVVLLVARKKEKA